MHDDQPTKQRVRRVGQEHGERFRIARHRQAAGEAELGNLSTAGRHEHDLAEHLPLVAGSRARP